MWRKEIIKNEIRREINLVYNEKRSYNVEKITLFDILVHDIIK